MKLTFLATIWPWLNPATSLILKPPSEISGVSGILNPFNCLIEAVFSTHFFAIHESTNPSTLWRPEKYSSFEDLESQYARRDYRKLRYSKCLAIVLFLTSENTAIWDQHFATINVINSETPVVFPRYRLTVCDVDTCQYSNRGFIYDSAIYTLTFDSNPAPGFQLIYRNWEITHGYAVSPLKCGRSKPVRDKFRLLKFECTNHHPHQCYENMMEAYDELYDSGRSAAWKTETKFAAIEVAKAPPMKRLTVNSTTVEVTRLILAGTNSSAWVGPDDSRCASAVNPSIRAEISRMDPNYDGERSIQADLVFTGNQAPYAFFTTNIRRNQSSSELGVLLDPFDTAIWMYCLLASGFFALAVFYLSSMRKTWRLPIRILFNVGGTWLDQFNFNSVGGTWKMFLIFSSWFWILFVLGQYYKGYFNVNFVVAPTYHLQTSSISEAFQKKLDIRLVLEGADCLHRNIVKMSMEEFSKNGTNELSSLDWIDHFHSHYFQDGMLRLTEGLVDPSTNATRWDLFVTCWRDFVENLLENGTPVLPVLVIFPTEEYSKLESKLPAGISDKLLGSGTVGHEDPLLNNHQGFRIATGGIPSLKYAAKRMHALMESGIFWLLEELEEFRESGARGSGRQHGLKYMAEHLTYECLGFSGGHAVISISIGLWAVGVVLSTVGFIVEVINQNMYF